MPIVLIENPFMLQKHDSNGGLYSRCANRHTLIRRYRAGAVVTVYCKLKVV